MWLKVETKSETSVTCVTLAKMVTHHIMLERGSLSNVSIQNDELHAITSCNTAQLVVSDDLYIDCDVCLSLIIT